MKKTPVFLSTLLVFGMMATAAFAPASGAGKLAALPFEFHSGLVTAYTPGVGLMVQDDSGNNATFSLDANVKILPPWRAEELQAGARVTLIVRTDPATQGLQAFGIFVNAAVPADEKAPPEDTPTSEPSVKPGGTPIDTATPKPELPTGLPNDKPAATPMDTPTMKPLLPTAMPPEKITPMFTPTMIPTATPKS